MVSGVSRQLSRFRRVHRWVGTVLLGYGLLTELCGFLLWWPRARLVMGPALIAMHLGIAATMNIFFATYVYQLAVLALPWSWLIDRFEQARRPRPDG